MERNVAIGIGSTIVVGIGVSTNYTFRNIVFSPITPLKN